MTTLQIVLIETLMRPTKLNGSTTRWRPALMDSEYKKVWRGSLYSTAEEAKEVATKQLKLIVCKKVIG